jgi:hypothetical protein
MSMNPFSGGGINFMDNPELKHTDKFGNHKFDETKAGYPHSMQTTNAF